MSDMERGRLISQHGAYSYQVQSYDHRVQAKKAADDAQWWSDYSDAHARPMGSGSPWVTGTGTGDTGAGFAKLIAATTVLFLLYGVWLFAIEAWYAIKDVWRHLFGTVLNPLGPGNPLLAASFVVLGLALLVTLRCFPSYRSLSATAQAALLAVAIIPGQVILWAFGNLLLSLPVFGELTRPVYRWIGERLPEISGRSSDVAAAAAAALLLVIGIPIIRVGWKALYKVLLFSARIALRQKAWLEQKGVAAWAAIGLALLLILLPMVVPAPPLSMPFGIWTYSAILAGAVFGWRIALIAAALGVIIGQPGYLEASSAFPDGTALQRIALWWGGLIGTAAAAGFFRPVPSNVRGEIRMALLATLFGLLVGWVTMLAIETFTIGTSYIGRLSFDYWLDFVPRYLPGYATSVAMGAVGSTIIRNIGNSVARRAAETEKLV